MENILDKESPHRRLDKVAKVIMQHKGVQAVIAKYAIPELADLAPKDIIPLLENGEDGDFISGTTTEIIVSPEINPSTVDVLCKIRLPQSNAMEKPIPVIKHTEIQSYPLAEEDLLDRSQYYLSILISYQKNRTFRGMDYDKIQRVYSTWVIIEPNKKVKNTHQRFEIMGKNQNSETIDIPLNSRLMNFEFYHLFCRPNGEYDGSVVEQMLYTLFLSEWDRKRIVGRLTELGVVNAESLEGEIEMCKDLYKAYIALGVEQGIEQGIEKGIEKERRKIERYCILRDKIKDFANTHAVKFEDAISKVLTSEESKDYWALASYCKPILHEV